MEEDIATILKSSGSLTTLAAISRETNINPNQLCHYASGNKTPRPAQRQRIIDGIHAIGRKLMDMGTVPLIEKPVTSYI